MCYFRDISKSVMAREALREADSRKDEFLATLSHELRNPLAPLRSSLEMLKLAGTAGPARRHRRWRSWSVSSATSCGWSTI